MRIAADATIDQETRKVRACHRLRVFDIGQRTVQCTRDAGTRQAVGHLARALQTAAARGGKPCDQVGVVGIEAQPDDVHRFAGEGDRDLGAGEKAQPQVECSVACALQAGQFIVVGQGQQLDAVVVGTSNHVGRGHQAIGYRGMAMQVGVQYG